MEKKKEIKMSKKFVINDMDFSRLFIFSYIAVIIAKLLELFTQIYITKIYFLSDFGLLFMNSIILLAFLTVLVVWFAKYRNKKISALAIPIVVFIAKELYNATIFPELRQALAINIVFALILGLAGGLIAKYIFKKHPSLLW